MAYKVGRQKREVRNQESEDRSQVTEWRSGGFSLIELLVIIGIASVLIAMAAIGMKAFITNSKLNEYRDQLTAYLEDAKARSITSVPHGIVFTANGYQLVRLVDGRCSTTTTTACTTDSDCTAPEVCQSGNFRYDSGETYNDVTDVASPVQLDNGYSINRSRDVSGSDPCGTAGDGMIWFDRKGVPRCSNWGLGMTTISIFSGSVSKVLIIDRSGKIKYEQ